jgi:hypothetical protein
MLSGGRSITGDYYQTPRKAQIKIMLAIAVAVPNGIDIRNFWPAERNAIPWRLRG